MHTADVGMHHLIKGFIGNFLRGAKVGVDGRVANQAMNIPRLLAGLFHQMLQLLGVIDVAGDGEGFVFATLVSLVSLVSLTEPLVDIRCYPITSLLVAAGDDYSRALLCHALCNGFADAAAGASDERGLTAEVKQAGCRLAFLG